jgi:hypothetical protein
MGCTAQIAETYCAGWLRRIRITKIPLQVFALIGIGRKELSDGKIFI